jgi:alanine or glycine:cation symporter, AGCS family
VELIADWVGTINGLVWGPPMLVLILGTGFFLMVGLRLMPILKLGYGFKMLWAGRHAQGKATSRPSTP